MLVTTNHWLSSAMVNETRNEIHFHNDINNNSQFTESMEPVWASLSLVISKL
jgi:hypothetical protein